MQPEQLVHVETPLGRVQGLVEGFVQVFRGLRYAEPPQRFQPAPPLQPWTGVRDATRHGSCCPQPAWDDVMGLRAPQGAQDEDCLFAEVYVPTTPGPKPVLVWIPGGGFMTGSACQYDAASLAQHADAVVVCINYRLGLLGWLDVSELGEQYRLSGDLWLDDQIAALKWVQGNIGAFGGDPECVTVVGESAGAASVIALCSVPEAQGLFHGAVACSPPRFSSDPRPDLLGRLAKRRRESRSEAAQWALRADPTELVRLGQHRDLTLQMTTTGPLLTAQPAEAMGCQASPPVPLLAGFTSFESDYFLTAGAATGGLSARLLPLLAKVLTRGFTAQVAGSAEEAGDYRRRLRQHHGRVSGRVYADLLLTDLFRAGAVPGVLATTAAGGRGYLYELDVPCAMAGRSMRSAHMADVPLTFRAHSQSGSGNMSDYVSGDTSKLSNAWVSALSQFARTGHPGGPLGEWPVYDSTARESLLITLDGARVVGDRDGEHRRGVWGDIA